MENNFNKYIKEIMNNPPEYAPDDKLWAKMKTRLDDEGKEKKRRIGGFLMWLPWLLALTTTTFAALIYFNSHSENIQSQKFNQKITHLQIDTIISKKTIIIYDTIYNSTVVNRKVKNTDFENANYSNSQVSFGSNRLLFNSNRNAFSGLFPFASFSNTRNLENKNPLSYGYISAILDSKSNPIFYSENNASVLKNNPTTTFDENKTNRKNELGLKTNISFLPSLPFAALEYQNNFDIDISLSKHQLIRKKKKGKKTENINYLLKIKPTSFSLAGFLGKAHALNLTSEWGELQAGGRAEIGYGRRFSLVIGFEKIDNSFDILYEKNEKKIENNFPLLPPNNSGDVLHEVYGDFEYWQVPFGIKYSILPRGVLHPYMGVGLISKKAIISTLRYEYYSLMGEYYVEQPNLLPDEFAITDFWTTLGFQFDLNRHWGLLLEGSTQFRLKKSTAYQYENTQLIKWNAGLQYNF